MRKVFGGALFTALAGMMVFGGVFAWQTSDSARGAAVVGANSFSIEYEPRCHATLDEAYLADDGIEDAAGAGEALAPVPCHSLIGPNGTTTPVGAGIGINEGDFDLQVVDGFVRVGRLHNSGGECSPADFAGEVRLLQPDRIIPPGGEGGPFAAYLSVDADAPADCQGNLVYYRVTIIAENPAGPTSRGEAESATELRGAVNGD